MSDETKTALSDQLVKETYDELYIGQSTSINRCAEILDVVPAVLKAHWKGLGLRLRNRSEAKRAIKQPGKVWEWPAEEASPTPEPIERAAELPDALEAIPALEAPGESVTFLVEPDGRLTDVEHKPAAAPDKDPGPGRRPIQVNGKQPEPAEFTETDLAFDELMDSLKDAFNNFTGKTGITIDTIRAYPVFGLRVDDKASYPEIDIDFMEEGDEPASDPGRGPTIEEIAAAWEEVEKRLRANSEPAGPADMDGMLRISIKQLDPRDSYHHPLMADIARLTAEFDAAGIPAGKAAKLALKAAELAAGRNQV